MGEIEGYKVGKRGRRRGGERRREGGGERGGKGFCEVVGAFFLEGVVGEVEGGEGREGGETLRKRFCSWRV